MSSSDESVCVESITPVIETSVDENSQKLVKRGKNKSKLVPLDAFVQPVAPGQNVCIFHGRNGQKNCKTLVRVAGQMCTYHHQKLSTPRRSEVARPDVVKSEGVIHCRYEGYKGRCSAVVTVEGRMCDHHYQKIRESKQLAYRQSPKMVGQRERRSKSSYGTVMFFMMALVVVACAGFVIGRQM